MTVDEHAADPLAAFATVDVDRERRQGVAELVDGPGKTATQISAIVTDLLIRCRGPVLVTRVEPDVAEPVIAGVASGEGSYSAAGRLLCWRPAAPGPVRVAVVTAGIETMTWRTSICPTPTEIEPSPVTVWIRARPSSAPCG